MADILDEAREEVRQEQLLALTKKYSVLIAVLTVLLIIGIVGYQLWKAAQVKAEGEASISYFDALEKLQSGDKAGSAMMLETLAKEAPAGYRDIAALQLAAQKVEAKKFDEAIAAYRDIEKNSGEKAVRELAAFLIVQLQVDQGKVDAETQQSLEAIAGSNGAWRFSALELQGLLQLQAKEYVKARDSFTKITTHPSTPRGLRQRSSDLILYTNYLEDHSK